MRVLVACEFSGVVRRAFRDRGHDAWSCDLLPAEDGETARHFTGPLDVFLTRRSTPVFDLMIAHPPCTHLCVSGARWFKGKRDEQEAALSFVRWLMEGGFVNTPRIAVENPIGVISSRIRKPEQIIQPWMFGHEAFKATCLWLKGLPKLKPTNVLTPPAKGTDEHKRWSAVHRAPPGPDRWKERSRTYEGIAAAMAEQWGAL